MVYVCIVVACVCLCVCLGVYMWVRTLHMDMCVHISMCMCAEVKGGHQVSCFYSLHFVSLIQGLSLNPRTRLAKASLRNLNPFVSALLSAGVSDIDHWHSHTSSCGCWDPNPGPPVCTANSLTYWAIPPSTHLMCFFYYLYIALSSLKTF